MNSEKLHSLAPHQLLLMGLSMPPPPKEKKKWDKRYDDVIQNNRINLPLNVRMEQSTVTNIVKQSKANDESWTLDVMLYREGVREGDNKKPAFTYKTEYEELKYYPITKDGKERTYTINTSTNIDEYVGKRILKINDHDLFRKFIITLAQDPEFVTMLNIMGGYVGVDQKNNRDQQEGEVNQED